MTKRKYSDSDQENSPIKKMCANPNNLVRARSNNLVLDLMRQGARKLWSTPRVQETMEVQADCRVCEKGIVKYANDNQIASHKCTFCEHLICQQCIVTCLHCGYLFCSFCSVRINSAQEDGGRCLSCF